MFALEWVQRFKDKDRGAKFFDARAQGDRVATARRRCARSSRRSRCCARCTATRASGAQLLDLADAVLERVGDGEERLFVAIQAGHIAFDKVNDLERAKKYFAIAASDRAAEPERPGLRRSSSVADEMPMASGSMPTIPAQTATPTQPRRASKRPRSRAAEKKRQAQQAQQRANAAAEEPTAGADEADAVEAPTPTPRSRSAPRPPAAAPRRRSRRRRGRRAGRAGDGRGRRGRSAGCRVPADLERRDGRRPRAPKVAPTRASPRGSKSSPRTRPTAAPRRELARVLRGAQSWAQLADALKDEEAKAAPTPAEKADGVPRARRGVRQAQQRQPGHRVADAGDPSRPVAARTRTTSSPRSTRTRSAGPISSRSSTRRPSARSTATARSRSICRSRTSTSSGSRTRPRRSRRSRRSSSSIPNNHAGRRSPARGLREASRLGEADQAQGSRDRARARSRARARRSSRSRAWRRRRSRSPRSARTGGRRLSSTSRPTTRR